MDIVGHRGAPSFEPVSCQSIEVGVRKTAQDFGWVGLLPHALQSPLVGLFWSTPSAPIEHLGSFLAKERRAVFHQDSTLLLPVLVMDWPSAPIDGPSRVCLPHCGTIEIEDLLVSPL